MKLPTRQEVVLGNTPVLREAPRRMHAEPVPAGTQGPMVRAGDKVHQLLTEDVVTLDGSAWTVSRTKLDHPTTSAIYYEPAGAPDGSVYYVNQAKDRLLRAVDGRVETVAQTPGITSAVTRTGDGRLLFGTGDGQIHTAGGSSWKSGVRAPERILEAPDGTTFVGAHGGLAAYGPDRQRLWGRNLPTARDGHSHPLHLSADGRFLYHSGLDSAFTALDAKTGETAWEVRLTPKEGDSFNEATMDPEGNLYAVARGGVIFKMSPEGKVLWKRAVEVDDLGSFVGGEVQIDADGNACVQVGTSRFQVYTPHGLPLLDLQGKEGLGADYVFDFLLSGGGHKALLMTRLSEEHGYRLVEVDLPGPAEPLLARLPEAPAEPSRTIEPGERQVRIGDIHLPVR